MMKWRNTTWAVAVVLTFGLARIPLEAGLEKSMRSVGLHRGGGLDLSMGEQLGQLGFVAVLGGFRSLAASILGLQAFTASETDEWGKVESGYELITSLQPRVAHYWDTAHWHMAYNAASHYQYRDQGNPVLRRQLYDAYVEKGRQFLEEGIRNNPGEYRLPAQMAELYRRRVNPPDSCLAADYYAMAGAVDGAPSYFRRFSAYQLALCPGREREAYESLRQLYDESERNRKPTLMTQLRRLEELLQIADAERVFKKDGG